MLRGIPACLSPELLKVLCEMGHTDTIVIGDAYYAAASNAKKSDAKLIRADGISAVTLLDAILKFFPLDTTIEKPVTLMAKKDTDENFSLPIWDEYKSVISKYYENNNYVQMLLSREFYDKAKTAYAVIATGQESFYGCIILQKGTI